MKYIVVQGVYLIDGESHTGYGIAYTGNSTLSFEDLTRNPTTIAELVRLCNELDLSPIHLRDVVEDFLIQST